MDDERFSLRGSEPIFPVADVVATVGYYREVLGFREGWTWGEPPDFGGVRWGKIGAMFALSSRPEVKVGGQWHSFFVEGIDALHDFHGRNGAAICSPLEAKPWGLREYTVRDLNGHYLRFGQRGSDRSATAGREPATDVAIVERLPTPEEYLGLVRAVGWARGDQADGDRPTGRRGARRGPIRRRRRRRRARGRRRDGARRRGDLRVPQGHHRPPQWQGRGVSARGSSTPCSPSSAVRSTTACS